MHTVSMHEAKAKLSELIDEVRQGQEIVIARAGKPAARLVPVQQPARPERKPGALKGKIAIAEDFDDPLPEALGSAFSGS